MYFRYRDDEDGCCCCCVRRIVVLQVPCCCCTGFLVVARNSLVVVLRIETSDSGRTRTSGCCSSSRSDDGARNSRASTLDARRTRRQARRNLERQDNPREWDTTPLTVLLITDCPSTNILTLRHVPLPVARSKKADRRLRPFSAELPARDSLIIISRKDTARRNSIRIVQ